MILHIQAFATAADAKETIENYQASGLHVRVAENVSVTRLKKFGVTASDSPWLKDDGNSNYLVVFATKAAILSPEKP